MNFDKILLEGSKLMNLNINSKQWNMIQKYTDMLLDRNEKINLTAITEPTDIAVKHFLDSFTPLTTKYVAENAKIIDVGTGAGFPGLPMKILRNDLKLTLLDSLNKRIKFLTEVTKELDLDSVECVHSRAEDAGQNVKYRESYDVVLSRAVSNMSSLTELCLPFVKVGGVFMALKGPMAMDELTQAEKAIDVTGGKIEEVISVPIPFSELSHNIVVVKKVRHTSTKYPRKAPLPTKTPIN